MKIRLHGFWLLVIFALAVGLPVRAENSAFYQFRHLTKSKVCRARLDSLKTLHKVFELSALKQVPLKNKIAAEKQLAGWSSDFLVQVALQLHQDYLVLCPEHKQAQELLTTIQKAYLRQLGFQPEVLKEAQVEKLFKGLLAFKSEIPPLKKNLQAIRSERPSAEEILPKLFGPVQKLRGVSVFGASPQQFKNLSAQVNDVCPGSAPCAFWDSRLIYKVVVRSDKVAAFVPEVAVLVLSESLLDKPNTLNKVVVLHELAHVAIRGAWVFERKDWVAQYAKLGGWQKNAKGKWFIRTRRLAGKRDDELSQLSKGSAFTILPDAIYVGEIAPGGKKSEGFALGKSYEESLANNDPGEDLADHVALLHLLPDRFCFQGRNIAPKKQQWIAEHVYKSPQEVECSAESLLEGK